MKNLIILFTVCLLYSCKDRKTPVPAPAVTQSFKPYVKQVVTYENGKYVLTTFIKLHEKTNSGMVIYLDEPPYYSTIKGDYNFIWSNKWKALQEGEKVLRAYTDSVRMLNEGLFIPADSTIITTPITIHKTR